MSKGRYRVSAGARARGLASTVLTAVFAVTLAFVTWSRFAPMPTSAAVASVNLAASDQARPVEKPSTAKPVAPPRPVHETAKPPIVPRLKLTVPQPVYMPVVSPSVPVPMPSVQPVAPPSTPPVQQVRPAPPSPPPAAPGADSWESHVLARIAKFRRYPGEAKRAHEQGIAYVHFRMDRQGHVLGVSLARSSGFPDLDQAALDTVQRAAPLPPIPADRPDQLDLSVPVEFYLR